MIPFSSLAAPIVLGATLNLDRQVFSHCALSRPLITGFGIGLICGELFYGVWMGLSVELLWLAALPLGGQIPPNAGLAVSATLIAWIGSSFAPAVGSYQTHAGLVFSFITVPFWAWAFTYIEHLGRKYALYQLEQAKQDLANGLDPKFFHRNISGFWFTFASSIIAIIIAIIINTVLLHFLALLAPAILLLNLHFLFAFIQFMGLMGMAVFLEDKVFSFYLVAVALCLLTLSAV